MVILVFSFFCHSLLFYFRWNDFDSRQYTCFAQEQGLDIP